MKQIVIKKGTVLNAEVPAPLIEEGFVLIKTSYSCISAGTEMAGIQRSKKSMLKRAMEKPEKLKMAVDMLKAHGIKSTVQQIKDLNDTSEASGYSVSGIVLETGSDIEHVKPGDRVAAAGGGYAIHAEYVIVPKNLVVKVPAEVSLANASVATIGAIALHGVHRSALTLGEYSVVIGCGIIGLITIQLLKASGVQVAAIDVSENRLQKAKELGADFCLHASEPDLPKTIRNWTGGLGVDAALFTAATSDSQPLSQAFQMCRRKGKLVLVGVSGLEIKREDIYTDEIDFLISSSYGPGRYDKNYELLGQDYPHAYVRWTESKNIAEILRLLQQKQLNLDCITDAVHPVEESAKAFSSLQQPGDKPLIVLIEYSSKEESAGKPESKIIVGPSNAIKRPIQLGLVGVGNFAKSVHIPNLNKLSDKFQIRAVASHKGLGSQIIANQNSAHYATADIKDMLEDSELDMLFICTRHDSHASLVIDAVKHNKHVFVEKPLAVKNSELEAIMDLYRDGKHDSLVMVGFNRRFSEYAQEIKAQVSNRVNPLFIRYRMNAGYLPADHWVHNTGGRIIGEACHIIDLMNFLTGSEIIAVNTTGIEPKTSYYSSSDNKTFTLKYADGSIASIDYFSAGHSSLPKEFMELHFDGKSIVMDDYKSLKGYGVKTKSIEHATPEKGHLNELLALYEFLSGKADKWPIDLKDMYQTTKSTLLIDGEC